MITDEVLGLGSAWAVNIETVVARLTAVSWATSIPTTRNDEDLAAGSIESQRRPIDLFGPHLRRSNLHGREPTGAR